VRARWAERAAEFAAEVVRPLGLVLDRAAGRPGTATPPLMEFLALAMQEGFTRLTLPLACGGAGLDRAGEYDVLEILAAADPGLTAVLCAAALSARIAGARRESCGCLVSPMDGALALRRDGSGWRLHGTPWRPVTAAAVAGHAVVACITADGGHHKVACVALDRDGIGRSTPPAEPGLRGRLAARLTFDSVRLERDEVLDERRAGRPIAVSLAPAQLLAVAIGCIGVARAAYENAARWRGERGLDAGAALARMRWELDITRPAVRRGHERQYGRLDAGEAMSTPAAVTMHGLAAGTALSLARRAVSLCGGGASAGAASDAEEAGVPHLDGTRFHPHKLLRDAIAASAAATGHIRPAASRAAPPQRIGSMEWAT
jgi:alkylation response protein AidB-like acyl-CoA dehydrogenase